MKKIFLTPHFKKKAKKLDKTILNSADKKLAIFRVNPKHPSLNTEKFIPKSNELWSFRINKNYRIIFKFIGKNSIECLDIATHDIYRKY